jgi:hypothetical protein
LFHEKQYKILKRSGKIRKIKIFNILLRVENLTKTTLTLYFLRYPCQAHLYITNISYRTYASDVWHIGVCLAFGYSFVFICLFVYFCLLLFWIVIPFLYTRSSLSIAICFMKSNTKY